MLLMFLSCPTWAHSYGNKNIVLYCITFSASKCQAWSLSISHGQESCSRRSGNSGIDCVFTCDSGFVFAEDINKKSVTVSCIDGGDWDRGAPTCQGKGSYTCIQLYVHCSYQ